MRDRTGNTHPRKRRCSTRQQLFLSYFCVCLVPIFLLAAALTVSSFRSRVQEEESRRSHACESAAGMLDSELRRLKALSLQLQETTWIKKRSAASGIFDREFDHNHRISICSDLRGYTATSSIINRLAVIFPDKGEVYSSTGLYAPEDFFHSYSMERDQEPLEARTVYRNMTDCPNGGLVRGEDLGMTACSADKLFYVEKLGPGSQIKCFLMVELSPSAISYLVSAIVPPDMVCFEISANSDRLLSITMGSDELQTQYTYQSRFFPVQMISGFGSLKAVHLSDYLIVAVLVLICLSFSVNLALFLTRLTYRPVQDLLERLQAPAQTSGTELDDFEVIAQAVSQLHTQNRNVLQMAEKYRVDAREACLRSLLQGDYNDAQAAEKLREFEIPFSNSMIYQVLLLEGCKLDLPMEEALASTDLTYEILLLSNSRAAAILAVTPEQKNRMDLAALIQQILFTCREHCGVTPACICGQQEAGISGIARSYTHALNRLESKLSDRIRTATSQQSCYCPTEWAMQLINHVRFGQQELAEQILTRLREENESRNLDSRYLITTLAQTYGRMIQELSANPADYEPQFDAIASEATADGMWQQLFALNRMLCRAQAAPAQENNIELQLVSYVKEHLTDPDISLKELSSRFNLSVSAISKLFKRTCGINFYDFLLSSRMDTACEIIKTQKLSLSAVARAVGYENEYSFKRAFSRFYGMSVSEYLRNQGAAINTDK